MVDFESVLIGVGMLLIFVVPFIYVQYKHKYTEKKNLAELLKKAEKHNLSFAHHDVWADYGIGIDVGKNILLYYNKKESAHPELLVDIKKLASCKKTTLKKSDGSTELISLVLKYKKDDTREERLEFFDIRKNSNLFKILPLADKWEKIIIGHIK